VVRIDAVSPEAFAAGETLSITGAGLREGDRFRLGSSALEVVELSAEAAKLRVPAAAKRGGALSVLRGPRTVASFAKLRFLSAPLLLAATPRFAVPGQRVTVKGKNLEAVSELRVGETAVTPAATTGTSISFVVPDGLQSGALSVRSPGGTAALPKPYEIYYPPVVTKVKPARFGAGATLKVEGTGLNEQLAIKLGATPITAVKKTKKGLELQLPATVKKGGPLTLRAAGRAPVRFDGVELVPAPRLLAAKPLSPKPGNTVQLKGTNLDTVDELRVGDQLIEPAARSATQLSFVVGPTLASGVIEVRGVGGTASLRTPLVVVGGGAASASAAATKQPSAPPAPSAPSVKADPGEVHAVRYVPAKGGANGSLRGRGFAPDTIFLLDGAPIDVKVVDAEHADFRSAVLPGAGPHELIATRGAARSPAYAFDGAAGGYRFAAERLPELLFADTVEAYSLPQIELDLVQSEGLYGSPAGSAAKHAGGTSTKAIKALGAAGLALTFELARMVVAQRALCAVMAPGKGKAADNAAAGAALVRATEHMHKLMREGLAVLWKGLPDAAFTDAATAEALSVAVVDERIGAMIMVGSLLERECADRYHGSGKLVTRASDTAKGSVVEEYEALMEGELKRVIEAGATPQERRQRVSQALSLFTERRRNHWRHRLSELTSRVQDQATVTGKGARTNKQATKVGKR
jgi:hypothetical protein